MLFKLIQSFYDFYRPRGNHAVSLIPLSKFVGHCLGSVKKI